ncbi:hypothetical protein HMPREF9004_0866 [Schaalia cardiffensis F0333]|uniref:Uncharacterized protein n=1 Tax=Schaalia cardiffensis F0333 TaxID=888050 RepID=N6X4H6_9ACTO|nr:hypothetical protein HMPREF9004_0866 [Schaalia cardiffensis F0333]
MGVLVQCIAMNRRHETREAFADRRGFTSYLARPARAIGSV